MKVIYLKSALKCDSCDVAIGIKIAFFRVLVTIEPGRSLVQFVTKNFLISFSYDISFFHYFFIYVNQFNFKNFIHYIHFTTLFHSYFILSNSNTNYILFSTIPLLPVLPCHFYWLRYVIKC